MSEKEVTDNATNEDIDSTEASTEKQEEVRRPKRRLLSSKRGKIVVVVVIIGIALAVGLWGAAPGEYKTLEEVVENSDSYIGEEVEMIGKVGNWTGGQNFTLVGRSNENVTLFIIHEKEMPDGFAEGKDVVVRGKLENADGDLTFRSNHPIQVGCPSKY